MTSACWNGVGRYSDVVGVFVVLGGDVIAIVVVVIVPVVVEDRYNLTIAEVSCVSNIRKIIVDKD